MTIPVTIIIVTAYLVIGWILVRLIHQNLAALPHVFVGIVAVMVWPITFVTVLIVALATSIHERGGQAIIELLFGKGHPDSD